MFSGSTDAEFEKIRFTTVNQLEYQGKSYGRALPFQASKDDDMIIRGAYEEALVFDEELNQVSEHRRRDYSTNEYHKKLKRRNSTIRDQMPDPPDQSTFVKQVIETNRLSEYQVVFCKYEDTRPKIKLNQCPTDEDIEKKGPSPKFVPTTTQRSDFCDPWVLAKDLGVKKIDPPKENLVPDLDQRRIMNVTTGLTEYRGVINTLADEVIKFQYHGPVKTYPNELLDQNND